MHKLLAFIGIAALAAGLPAKTSNTPGLSASAILQRTNHAYATCRSYRDTGTVTAVSTQEGDPSYHETISFRTTFKRPDRFRFEFNSSQGNPGGPLRLVTWTSKGKAYLWWTVDPKVSTEESLDTAIAKATGVSYGAAHDASKLLMPKQITGVPVTKIENPRLSGTERVDGTGCFKIEGRIPTGTLTVWVAKDNYLIRKVELQTPDHRAVLTSLYHPELNPVLPASAFDSGVPK